MKIGFYGHSNCAYRSDDSLVDLLARHFNSEITNTGVRQGSEERILFELKKTKELDLAIIFHSEPQYLFLPDCDRDYGLNNLRELRVEYIFEHWNNQFSQEHHSKMLSKFKDAGTFYDVISKYKEYLYHPDLQLNRFYGSLIQIDQYLTAKNIPAIHIVNNSIPQWFKFTSGIIDQTINLIIKQHSLKPGEWFVNCISKDGNMLVAKRLKELVEELNPPSLGAVA